MKKINESYFQLISSVENIKKIKTALTIERPEMRYTWRGKMGMSTAYHFFNQISETELVIPNGFLEIFGYKEEPEFTEDEINDLIQKFKSFEPYDFQKKAIIDSLLKKRNFVKSATGSGKSLIIALIAKILTYKGLRGLILVPNISLIEQFLNDIQNYNLNFEFNYIIKIGGKDSFDNTKFKNKWNLVISTYQSLIKHKEILKNFDFILTDEAHQTSANEIFDINNRCLNAKYKIGFSGTIPVEKADKFRLLSIFGKPTTYITTRGLIDKGLATDCEIIVTKLNYKETQGYDYQSSLKFLKENQKRNEFILNLVNKIRGNSLVLFSHTEHGLKLFHEFLKLRGIELIEKCYKNIVFQRQNEVYFINGLIEGEQREMIRKILEKSENAVIFANYQTTSTGVNMKKLHNVIFASPLKSYITITQSIGRGLRLHQSKDIFRLFDICDNFGFFKNQYNYRLKNSYEPEGYVIKELNYNI